jgi:hypothetical protein
MGSRARIQRARAARTGRRRRGRGGPKASPRFATQGNWTGRPLRLGMLALLESEKRLQGSSHVWCARIDKTPLLRSSAGPWKRQSHYERRYRARSGSLNDAPACALAWISPRGGAGSKRRRRAGARRVEAVLNLRDRFSGRFPPELARAHVARANAERTNAWRGRDRKRARLVERLCVDRISEQFSTPVARHGVRR